MIEEGERLGKVLGDKDILFMCHHGTLVVADSIHVAFDEVRILNYKKKLWKIEYNNLMINYLEPELQRN